MINVAVIGTGYIGKVHLETLQRIPNVQVKAIVTSNPDAAKNFTNIEIITNDYRELLENSNNIDVFHNCTPNHSHFAINKDLLAAGKYIFCEKPLAISAEQCRVLCDLAASKNILTAINFCYRYYPVIQDAAVRVQENEIGKVHTIFGSYFQDWLLYETDYNWRLDKKFSGISNTVADIGSHWLDLAQFVSNTKIVEVFADLRTILPTRKKSTTKVATFAQKSALAPELQDIPIELDDYGSILLHFANGAAGAFSVCQLCAGKKCSIDLQLYGTKSALAWNHEQPGQLQIGHRNRANEIFSENPLLQHNSTAHFARLPAGHPMGYFDAEYNLFSEFYHAINLHQQGSTIDITWPTFQDGYEKMLLIEAIVKSHLEKKWVTIGNLQLRY
jgi:predicted dehydrogenase